MGAAGERVTIEVGAGEVVAERGEVALTCVGLGSCVAVALWDPGAEVGGLAHIVLPDSRRYDWQARPGMFADRAPAALVEAVQGLGGRRSRLAAKVTGGANLFTAARGAASSILEVGRRNVDAALETLRALRIPVVGQDTGGTTGRSVEFSIGTGRLRVRATGGPGREL